MLNAMTKEGELVTLLDVRRPEAIKMRDSGLFYCVTCKEPLALKAGDVRIPHFSHLKLSSCSNTVTEPETPRHLKGKKDLYRWFVQNGLEVQLEKYLPDLEQRPDLLVTQQKRQIAVEFQCTPISVSLIQKRTLRFLSAGITPLWIVGGRPYSRRGGQTYQLSEYLWSLTSVHQNQIFLPAYEPENGNLELLSHITCLSPASAAGHLQINPLHVFTFPFQLPSVRNPAAAKIWIGSKHKWLERKVRFGNMQDPFLRELYLSGEKPFLLPAAIGLPVPYMEHISSHPIEWQFFIWKDCLSRLSREQRISPKYVNYKLEKRMKEGVIKVRKLPLHAKSGWKLAVSAYITLLTALFYLREAGEDCYQMVKPFRSPKHMEEGLKDERTLLDALAAIEIN